MDDSKRDHPISYDAYQKMAELYATIVNTKPYNAYYERPATLSLMPDVMGMNVLDAGCGAGFYANWFANHGAQVIGLDFSEKMIAYSRELVGDRGEFHIADLNQRLVMIEDDAIDLVNSSLTLHYLTDLEFTFSEFARVLKPEGILIFSVHHPFDTLEWHKIANYHDTQVVSGVWQGMRNTEVTYYHRSLSAYVEALFKNGFIIEQLLEPQPEEYVKEINQDTYRYLKTRPVFLFFKAIYRPKGE